MSKKSSTFAPAFVKAEARATRFAATLAQLVEQRIRNA